MILTLIQGVYGKKHVSGVYVDCENKGVLLNEGEFFEYRFGRFDGIMVYDPEEGGPFSDLEDLFLVDSAGKKYHVKEAKQNIKLVQESKHPFGSKC